VERAAGVSLNQRVIAALEARGSYPTWVLIAALAGVFATSFPITILTISLSSIAEEFGVRETVIAWVVSAPILLSAVALPLLGKLGDLYGHRRVFLVGFCASTLSAFATALAWDAPSLIALRTFSAIVGAATQPAAMALIFNAYPAGERVVPMGWWAMMGAAAPATGLVAGGPLVDLFGWRVVFVLQSASSLLALAFASAVLKETPRQQARFDLLGALTLAVGVGALMLALGRVREPEASWVEVAASIAIGIAGILAFVRVERRVEAPLLPLEYFRLPNFSAALLAGSFMGAAYMGAFVIAPIVLLQLFHYSVTATAAIMLMRTMTLTVSSPIGGRLGLRLGERAVALLGSAIVAVSLIIVASGCVWESLPIVCVGLVLQGLGNGLGGPPMTTAVVDAVPIQDVGVAAAASRLTSQVGVAFGITTLTMVYGGHNTGRGLALAFLVGAVFALCSLAAGVRMQRRRSLH
jgi:EmrB/QacA subfamily drug resistance transporter